MTFYEKLQLSPGVLREKIKHAKSEKKQWLWALFLRSFLILVFAIGYISLFSVLFGAENSYVGVGSFCMLLSLRFVNYGYHVVDSLVALFSVLSLFLVNSIILSSVSVGSYFLINLLSLLFILFLTTSFPEFGNGGVYAFSYILITSNGPHTIEQILPRVQAIYFAFVLCAFVFIYKQQKNNRNVRLHHLVKNYSLKNKTYTWQLRLALGITFSLTLGKILLVPREMWMGFASMSLLLPQTHFLLSRGIKRFLGVILGSSIFVFFLVFLPKEFVFLLGPVAGFLLGLTANYFWASVLNCFGALSAAYVLFGSFPAGVLRISNNFIGLLCALFIALLFKWWAEKGDKKEKQPVETM